MCVFTLLVKLSRPMAALKHSKITGKESFSHLMNTASTSVSTQASVSHLKCPDACWVTLSGQYGLNIVSKELPTNTDIKEVMKHLI